MEITDRQQEIILSSLEIITEGGIQALTIKNLAKKIGFSEAAVYRHYENKVQILLAILEYFRQNSEKLFNGGSASEGSTIEKLETIFRNHFIKFSEHPSLVSVIFSEEIFKNETKLTEAVTKIMDKNINSLSTILEQGQVKGEIRDDLQARHLAIMVMGSLRMFIKGWHMANHKFDLKGEGSSFIRSVTTVIKKS